MFDTVLKYLKKIPVDFGQQSVADRTYGKVIAMGLVPPCEGEAKKAIDVGCRDGVQTKHLQDLGYQVTSVDVESSFPGCLSVDLNHATPFDDDEFDLVWCSEVIEHLEKPFVSYREILRITKPGGVIILTTPNSYFWLFRLLALFGLTPDKLQRKDHLHFFCYEDLIQNIENSRIFGFFPYFIVKRKIEKKRLVSWLSPTFVVCKIKGERL